MQAMPHPIDGNKRLVMVVGAFQLCRCSSGRAGGDE